MNHPFQGQVSILLVDDKEEGLLSLAMALDSPEYHLVKAQSGQAALDLLPQYDFALILLDVQMPGLDGFETAKRIKKLGPRQREIPIIFVTAISTELRFIYEGYESGAVDYLVKPLDPAVIRSKVAIFAEIYRKNVTIKEQARLLLETERKDRERHLAQLELENLRRYRNLTDAIPHIIWKAKADGTLDYFNELWSKYTGLNNDQSSGTGWQTMIHASDLASLLERWIKAGHRGGDAFEMECRIKRRDGIYRWHLVGIMGEKNNQGELIAWIGTCTDIHDLKKREDELRSKAEETSRLNEELSRSNKELEQFAYVASHDLQEPLHIVSTYLDLLAARYKGRLDEEADQFIDYAHEGAMHAQQLIRDLLELARIGPKESRLVKTDFEQVLDRVLFDLKLMIDETGAEIQHDPLPEIIADDSQMAALFQNLLSNALKFKNEKPLKIHISARRENQEWIFGVSDNGIGISPQYQERIFDIFKRLHNKDNYPGTGIGLAICKKIMERHCGKIWVESEPQKGATFYFKIPESLNAHGVEGSSPSMEKALRSA